MLMQWFIDLVTWWSSLSPAATFFFLMPFVVVAVAALAHRINPS